jgi:hypothetical protein
MGKYKEQPTVGSIKDLIEYIEEGDYNIDVVLGELNEMVLRMTGEYWDV